MNENSKTRTGDAPFTQPCQTCRFIEITGEWFFFTREKELLGPYRSQRIVEHAAKLYGKKKAFDANSNSVLSLFGNKRESTRQSDNPSTKRPTKSAKDDNIVDFEHPNWDL